MTFLDENSPLWGRLEQLIEDLEKAIPPETVGQPPAIMEPELEENALLDEIKSAVYPILAEGVYVDVYEEEDLPLTVVFSMPYNGSNLVQTFVEPTVEEILERLDEGYLR